MTAETWRDALDFEGYYEVSDRGRVRGVDRTVPVRSPQRQRRLEARILQPWVPADGHAEQYCFSKKGIQTKRNIDRLMREAGFDPLPHGAA